VTPPAATAVSRRRPAAAARRRQVRTRRLGVAAVLGAIALALAIPLLRQAVREFELPLAYPSIIRQQAADKHLDPALVAAVIYAETKFDPRPSSAGAEGVMQIMPATAEFLAHRSGATSFSLSDLGRPQVNIAYGAYYLRYLLNEYGGNKIAALAAYNGGETNVSRWIARERSEGRPLTISEIPFPETRDYVTRVLQAQRDYRSTYAQQLGYW
jgi:soluble lytic murein transglycosylase